jgi:hypothetical protein
MSEPCSKQKEMIYVYSLVLNLKRRNHLGEASVDE